MKERNKFYFIILIVILTIFVLSNLNLNGRAVGYVNITIIHISSLNFTLNSVDFGAGSVYLNSSNATIDTTGIVIGGNWTQTNEGFIIENLGNTNLSVFLKSEKNATEFLGGTNPEYYYMFNNFEPNSCTENASAMNSWLPLNNTGYGDKICTNMQYIDSNDTIRLDLRLVIPSDAIRGSRFDVLTVTGINN